MRWRWGHLACVCTPAPPTLLPPRDGSSQACAACLQEALPALEGTSLNLFPPDHPVRLLCTDVVNHRLFGYLVLALILVNLLALAMDAPAVDPGELGGLMNGTSGFGAAAGTHTVPSPCSDA